MNGGVKFEDAFHDRLQLIKPTATMMQEMERRYPPVLSVHVEELIHALHRKGTHVYLVSGGMKEVIT